MKRPTPLTPAKARCLNRLSDGQGRFGVLAVDQRPPLMQVAARATGKPMSDVNAEVSQLKGLLAETLSDLVTGILVDPYLGFHTVLPHVRRETGLLVTLEHHAFREVERGHRLSAAIPGWSVERAVQNAAEGIKVLAWYRPDAPDEVKDHQLKFVREMGDACAQFDRPYIFEILPYQLEGESAADYAAAIPDLTMGAIEDLKDPSFGVDLYKLALPVAPQLIREWGGQGSDLAEAESLMRQITEALPTPWVLLSGGMDTAAFVQAMQAAARAGASGYMAGRAVWAKSLDHYPDLDATRAALMTDGRQALSDLNQVLQSIAPDLVTTDYTIHPAGQAAADLVHGEY